MKCGWDCGAQLSGRNMRAHFTICAKQPAGSDLVDPRKEEFASQAWPPTGAADEMRLGLRRSAYRAQYARAFDHMREAVGNRRPSGPAREEPESQARTATGAANAVRPALRLPTHGEPDGAHFAEGRG